MPDESKTETSSPSQDEPANASPPVPTATEAAPPAEDAEAGPSDEPEEPVDPASPEAILKRVTALGEDDEIERIARAEEAKLEARRREGKKPKKKSGLEAAASKRLAKIGAKAPVKRSVATAADADPLLDKATELSRWAKKNQKAVTAIATAAAVALAGTLGYVAYERRHESQASVELAKAIADERGRIGDPDKEEEPDRPHDPTPIFKTSEDRREAALAGYRAVESKYRGTGAAMLARLSEGSLLLDKEDADGALAAYGDVSTSPLARADSEVRGRALEGMGFAYELKADGQTGDGAKGLLDQAAKEYRELENTDVAGFKELGMYHQARILQKQGSTEPAVDLLKKLHERLHKTSDDHKFVYLEQVADDALRALAPDALPPRSPGMGGPGGRSGARGGKNQLDPAQLQKMYEQLQRAGAGKGLPPGPPPAGTTK